MVKVKQTKRWTTQQHHSREFEFSTSEVLGLLYTLMTQLLGGKGDDMSKDSNGDWYWYTEFDYGRVFRDRGPKATPREVELFMRTKQLIFLLTELDKKQTEGTENVTSIK